MREIKFRAWVVDEYEEDGNTPATFIMVHWFPDFFSDTSPVTRWGSEFPDDPEIVVLMQYTGLKDKNGVEIYEGDICKRDFGLPELDQIIQVKFNNGCFIGDDVGRYPLTENTQIRFVLAGFAGEIEVIGNLYENPELLK